MGTELLDILDTAVKIGLGALISGVSTYYVAKHNQSAESKKQFTNRKLGIIEAVTGHVDEFISALSRLIAAIDGVRRNHPEKGAFDLRVESDAALWQFIRENDDKFCEVRDHASFASSKLYLLGIPEAAELLARLTELSNDIRTIVLFQDQVPTTEQLSEWRTTVSNIKKEFFREIGRYYKA